MAGTLESDGYDFDDYGVDADLLNGETAAAVAAALKITENEAKRKSRKPLPRLNFERYLFRYFPV